MVAAVAFSSVVMQSLSLLSTFLAHEEAFDFLQLDTLITASW